MFRKILVGFDGSQGSWKALRAAIALAKLQPGSELWAVSVEEHLPRMPEVIDELAEEKDRENEVFAALHREAAVLARKSGVALNVKTIAGHAAQGIVRFARQLESDLVVIGHSGHSGVWGTFLGGTAEKVVRHATCAVLVVR